MTNFDYWQKQRGDITADTWDECTPFQRSYIKWVSFFRAHYDRITRNNWGATMNYAILASFDMNYMSKVVKYYTRARSKMLRKMEGPNGHLVVTKDGFKSTCCREMHDSIIFKEVDLNYDYVQLFSSIRVDSLKVGKIERTDRCPFCGAKIEGIKVRLED